MARGNTTVSLGRNDFVLSDVWTNLQHIHSVFEGTDSKRWGWQKKRRPVFKLPLNNPSSWKTCQSICDSGDTSWFRFGVSIKKKGSNRIKTLTIGREQMHVGYLLTHGDFEEVLVCLKTKRGLKEMKTRRMG